MSKSTSAAPGLKPKTSVEETKQREILDLKKRIICFCDIDDTALDLELSEELKAVKLDQQVYYINGSNKKNDAKPLIEKIKIMQASAEEQGYEFYFIFLTHKPIIDDLCYAVRLFFHDILYDINVNNGQKIKNPIEELYWCNFTPNDGSPISCFSYRAENPLITFDNNPDCKDNTVIKIGDQIIPALLIATSRNGVSPRPKAACMEYVLDTLKQKGIPVDPELTFLLDDLSDQHESDSKDLFGSKRFNFVSAKSIAVLGGSLTTISQRTQETLAVFDNLAKEIQKKIDLDKARNIKPEAPVETSTFMTPLPTVERICIDIHIVEDELEEEDNVKPKPKRSCFSGFFSFFRQLSGYADPRDNNGLTHKNF